MIYLFKIKDSVSLKDHANELIVNIE